MHLYGYQGINYKHSTSINITRKMTILVRMLLYESVFLPHLGWDYLMGTVFPNVFQNGTLQFGRVLIKSHESKIIK